MTIIITSGKRKSAIARAVLKEGTGIVKINHKLIDTIQPELLRMKVREPLLLVGAVASKVDISVTIEGGGVASQADAARLAIAKALLAFSKDPSLEQIFDDYDRHLLVADVRRKETKKPNTNSKARAKKQKSYR
jgi:small subunit ribosomal protein S9